MFLLAAHSNALLDNILFGGVIRIDLFLDFPRVVSSATTPRNPTAPVHMERLRINRVGAGGLNLHPKWSYLFNTASISCKVRLEKNAEVCQCHSVGSAVLSAKSLQSAPIRHPNTMQMRAAKSRDFSIRGPILSSVRDPFCARVLSLRIGCAGRS